MKIISNEACTGYQFGRHPEKPSRVARTQEMLRGHSSLIVSWAEPEPAPEDALLRAHTPECLARLDEPTSFDEDTPFIEGIARYARTSAGGALAAAACARTGEAAFSLMRPPGHHATRNRSMGFCYVNNIAIAVLDALAKGTKRIAVFDFDVHHGNGTEDILKDVPGVAFYSVHQHPCYPNTGTRNVGANCFNYPVPPHAARGDYRAILSSALAEAKKFHPEILAISAGFDAYVRDPLADEDLEVEDFHWLGREIRNIDVPTFSLLEGGYSRDLPELIVAYLKGMEGLPL